MYQKFNLKISFFIALLSWGLYAFSDLYFIQYGQDEINPLVADLLPNIFVSTFILSVLNYYRSRIRKAESLNFANLLWRIFVTGLITTLIALLIQLIFYLFTDHPMIKQPMLINFLYHILVALVVIYMISTFVVWKRLILYQKSKRLLQLWNFFEYGLFGGLIILGVFRDLNDQFLYFLVIVFTILSFFLAFNLKWIAYLSFGQKLKSILLILLSGIYLFNFYLGLSQFSTHGSLQIDLLDSLLIIQLFIFLFIYPALTVLVILFNLPTSSVVERKLKEAVEFQRLSNLVTTPESEGATYRHLIESAMNAVLAEAAWIERKEEDNAHSFILRGVTVDEVQIIKQSLSTGYVNKVMFMRAHGEEQIKSYFSFLQGRYQSAMALPIFLENRQVAALVLLHGVKDAFNLDLVNIVTTYINQISAALLNARLLRKTIQNERYQEQLKIAKLVQKRLLPDELAHHASFDIVGLSKPTEEVGGDYYDGVQLTDDKYGIFIADVSGKGTSAAFNMAQMKGVFHSLTQLNLSPTDFIIKANEALGKCLEKSSFITAAYHVIDVTSRTIEFVRAGHCRALQYTSKDQKAQFLEGKGLGLGILRNKTYDNYVHAQTIDYCSGDILVLYTDGIIEATNDFGVAFGEEGLRNSLINYVGMSPKEIMKGIMDELYEFTSHKMVEDDYSAVVIKF